MAFDAVVVGGGIVGCACAAEFAEAGLSVALIESRTLAGGATGAAMGHMAVMDDSEAQFALTRYSQLLWRGLSTRLPADAGYTPCGAIWVAANEAEMGEVRRKHAFYEARQTPVEILDALALADAEPHLRKGLAGGLLVSDDAVVDPPRVAEFLAAEAQNLGARIFRGSAALQVRDGSVTLADGTEISAASIVVANGIDAAALIPGARIQPRKGHLLITGPHPNFVRHQVIELGYLQSAHAAQEDSVAFNVQPRPNGQVLIGSSRQYGSVDPAIDEKIVSAMLQRATQYMPLLAGLPIVRGWTGFRAATADKLPLIGLAPGYRSVYLAAGHEGLGITTSLSTAKLLADALCGRESAIPREPYAPERKGQK